MNKLKLFALAALFFISVQANAQTSGAAFLGECFAHAARLYGRSPGLYRAIAQVESSGCRSVEHVNTNGTVDIGCMQINSSLLPALSSYGITKARLLNDACLNIHVGAWILEEKIRRYGANWEAVGAYNTACSKLKGAACAASRNRYITKVWRAFQEDVAGEIRGTVNVADRGAATQLRVSGEVER